MTSRESRSRELLLVCCGLGLVLLTGFCVQQLWSAQAEATQARVSMVECRGLVEDILQLSKRPRVVALEASSQTSVSERIEAAVAGVGLPTRRLRSVTPEQAEPIENTQYVNQVTRLQVEQATLRQILLLASELEAQGAGFRVRDVVVTASGGSAPGLELWDLEAMLTQTVFSPTTR